LRLAEKSTTHSRALFILTLTTEFRSVYIHDMIGVICSVNLQWLEEEFLGYLDKWEEAVRARPGFSPKEKNPYVAESGNTDGTSPDRLVFHSIMQNLI